MGIERRMALCREAKFGRRQHYKEIQALYYDGVMGREEV